MALDKKYRKSIIYKEIALFDSNFDKLSNFLETNVRADDHTLYRDNLGCWYKAFGLFKHGMINFDAINVKIVRYVGNNAYIEICADVKNHSHTQAYNSASILHDGYIIIGSLFKKKVYYDYMLSVNGGNECIIFNKINDKCEIIYCRYGLFGYEKCDLMFL